MFISSSSSAVSTSSSSTVSEEAYGPTRTSIEESAVLTHLGRTQAGPRKSERRSAFRVVQHRPVKILDRRTNRYLPAQTVDISSTGLCVSIPTLSNLAAGQLLNIHIGLSTAGQPLANRRAMLPVRVVWTKKSPRHPQTLCGLELVQDTRSHMEAA